MEFFDANAAFGRYAVPPLRQAETAAQLRAEMDFCGIARALVRHAAMQDQCPTLGNRLLAEEIDGVAGLEPAWAILPPQTGELGTVEEFLAAMTRSGVRALWAFPGEHRYLLNGITFGELFEELTARRVPLFLNADWPLLHQLLPEFPRLTVVAANHGSWGQDRYFRPLVERFPNFYLDTARYELGGGIEAFCQKYGPDRLLFGTGYPRSNMGGPLLTLLHADIPDRHREAIAAGNLIRLLGEVRL